MNTSHAGHVLRIKWADAKWKCLCKKMQNLKNEIRPTKKVRWDETEEEEMEERKRGVT